MCPFIHIFGFQLPTFGMMMCVGMIAAFILLGVIRRWTPFTEDEILSAALWTIILGMAGAKLLYWITELKSILANPAVFKDMLTQGFVFYGSLIGGILGLFIYVRRNKKPFFALCDLFIPALVLGQAFGRIGCFLSGCCYGAECHGGMCVTFPYGAGAGVPRIPVQLYESAFLFLLTAFLVWLLHKRKTQGTVIGWYGILYGVWRFIIEFFRQDDRGAVGALSTSQFIGLFVIAGGAAILILIARGVIRDPIVSRETMEEPEPKDAENGEEAAESVKTQDSPGASAEEALPPENPAAEEASRHDSGSGDRTGDASTQAGAPEEKISMEAHGAQEASHPAGEPENSRAQSEQE